MSDFIQEFCQRAQERGLILAPSTVTADGKLYRCDVDAPGAAGKGDGAYLLHLDEHPAGGFQNHRDGLGWENVSAKRQTRMTDAERIAFRAKLEEQRREREESERQQQEDTRKRLVEILETRTADATNAHPYAIAKGVKVEGRKIRLYRGDKVRAGLALDGALLVPLYVAKDPKGKPEIVAAQFIAADGQKRFWGSTEGAFFPISKPDRKLIICEGVATGLSLHEATGIAVFVALNCGNLENVGRLARARYGADLELIYAADDDWKTIIRGEPANPGLEAANAAALATGGSVAVPEFPAERPEKATDFNDSHKLLGLEAVRKAIEGRKTPTPLPESQRKAESAPQAPTERGNPRPLAVALKPEPYPLEALPDLIGAAVREVQSFTKCPTPLVAASAIAAVSVTCQALADVRRMSGLEGPSPVYLLTIGESGERKSTCDKHFTQALKDWLADKCERDRMKIAEARANLDAWRAECDGLRDSIRSNSKQGKEIELEQDKKRLAETMARKPAPFYLPFLLRGEDTPEKLAAVMANQSPSLGIISAEGGTILGGHGMKSDSLQRTLSQYNVFWDGGQLSRGRMGADSDIDVKGGRLTLHLMVQESMFREFNDSTKGLARGSGFMARFLLSWPDSTIGTRFISQAPSWTAMAAFDGRIRHLLEEAPRIEGQLSPRMLELSAEASALWKRYADVVEKHSGPGRDFHDVKDIAAKSADNAARLAALFHVFQHGAAGSIGADAMQSGICVASWHLNEARRFLGGVGIPAELFDASRLDSWLQEYTLRPMADRKEDPKAAELAQLKPNEVLVKTVYQFGPHGMRDRTSVHAAVTELEEQDRAWLETRGRFKVIVLNPRLCAEAQQ